MTVRRHLHEKCTTIHLVNKLLLASELLDIFYILKHIKCFTMKQSKKENSPCDDGTQVDIALR